jgi:hypothetical protein
MIRHRQLRASAIVAAISLSAACATAVHSPSPSPIVPIAFTASSLQSIYGIQGRFEGTVTVQGNWLEVEVLSGALRGFQGDAVHYSDLRVRATVASCISGHASEATSESRAVKLGPVFGIGTRVAGPDTALRVMHDTLRFSVAVPRGTSLDRSWLAFVLEWPFENSFATYSMNTDVALSGAGARRPNC